VRKDSPHITTGPDDPSTEGRPDTLRNRVAAFLPALVWVLVFGTSAAVASLSWWLVPPYLALMGVLLYEPTGRRVNATNPAGPVSASSGAQAPVDVSDPVDDAGSNVPDPSAEGSAQAGSATATKARRGTRGRSKKARAVPEPAPAAWVQVAPGKFVRVEPGSPLDGIDPRPDPPERPRDDSGPHDTPPENALEIARPETSSPDDHPSDGPRGPEFAEIETHDDSSDIASDALDVSDDLDPRSLADAADASRPVDEAGIAEAEGSLPDAPTPTPADAPEDHGRPDDETAASEADPLADAFTSEFHDSEGDEPDESDEFTSEADAGWSEPEPIATDAEVDPGDEPEPTDADRHAPLADDAEVQDDDAWDEDVYEEPERESSPTEPGPFRRALAPAQAFGHGVSPSRRNVRSDRADRPPLGIRRRSPRGVGRQRHLLRAFPPRSPPHRGVALV
jgi:hypothetical protein